MVLSRAVTAGRLDRYSLAELLVLHARPIGLVAGVAVSLGVLITAALALLGTDSSSAGATTSGPTNAAATFTDPFAYCGAVGNALHPDARYTGSPEPESVVRALERALGSKEGTLDRYAKSGDVYWRCQDSRVLACFPGANLTCWDANTDRSPTNGEVQWCAEHPGDGGARSAIPFVVTGHSTVYEWRCVGSTPTVMQQIAQVDAAGLIARIWYTLSPN